MTDETPNPSFRAMKTEKGVPTTGVTITPLAGANSQWTVETLIALNQRAARAGIKLSHGEVKDPNLVVFLLDKLEDMEARLAALEVANA